MAVKHDHYPTQSPVRLVYNRGTMFRIIYPWFTRRRIVFFPFSFFPKADKRRTVDRDL